MALVVALCSLVGLATACSMPGTDSAASPDNPAEPDPDDRNAENPESDRESGSIPAPTEPAPRIERDLDAFPDLKLDPAGPGSDAAYDQLIAELEEYVDDDVREAPPWPDLRNPDPAIAYETCSRFQNWIAENDPDPALVSGYAAPNSPEWGWDRDLFSIQQSLGWLAEPSQPPYSLSIIDVVDPGASPISDDLLAEVPPGSAAVVYYDSVGESVYLDRDGNVVEEREGWVNVGPWVAIMEPTDAGWRVWWDELVDPPPGEEWERGPQSRLDQPNRV